MVSARGASPLQRSTGSAYSRAEVCTATWVQRTRSCDPSCAPAGVRGWGAAASIASPPRPPLCAFARACVWAVLVWVLWLVPVAAGAGFMLWVSVQVTSQAFTTEAGTSSNYA